jgi:hypothetical protein
MPTSTVDTLHFFLIGVRARRAPAKAGGATLNNTGEPLAQRRALIVVGSRGCVSVSR